MRRTCKTLEHPRGAYSAGDNSPLRIAVTQPAEEEYSYNLAITVDVGPNQKPIVPCYEVQPEEVCLR